MRSLIRAFTFIAVAAFSIQFGTNSFAVQPAVSFEEVVQTADLIFSGRVTHLENVIVGAAAFTEVTFAEVETIEATSKSRQKHQSAVKLRYAGGQIGDEVLSVSDAPRFLAGHKYLICMLDDKNTYLNPIVAGPQGYFEIIEDVAGDAEYVVNAAGKSVLGITDKGELTLSVGKLEYVGNGVAGYAPPPAEAGIETRPAVSEDGRAAEVSNLKTKDLVHPPILLEDFKRAIPANVSRKRSGEPRLKRGDERGGKFYTMENGKLVGRDLATTMTRETDFQSTNDLGFDESEQPSPPSSVGPRGQTLAPCGSHDLFLIMEDVPNTTPWAMEYNVDQSCMSLYNQYMDIFRVGISNGVGNNSENEFGGYPDSATLASRYGIAFSWGTSLGVCFTSRISTAACAKIIQSDIYWNPAYNYSEDPNIWWNSNNIFCMRQITVHELGHAWGYQVGVAEQYDYDQPSVMHSVYSDIYETGKGLHAEDARLFRNLYSIKTGIKNIRDIGAEGYYALNGLNKSGINKLTFARGEAMDFTNVTVENMSNSDVNDVKMRFYLSTKRDFSGSAYQVGNTWSWSTFNKESRSVGNYAGNTIPQNVPPGTYYVLVDASINFNGDDYNENNTGVFSDRVTIFAPSIGVSPPLTKNINQGQNASADLIYIENTVSKSGVMNYSLAVSYGGSSSGWLNISPMSGSCTTEYDPINLNFSTAGLSPGTHTATISVSSPEATNSPQTCLITVNVAAVPTLSRTPSTITRNITGGTNASTDTFEVWNSGNSSALSYTISDDVSWLSVSPSSGTSTGAHQFHTISYNTSGLSQGNYFATITISSPGASNPSSSILVFMNVAAPVTNPTISRTPATLYPYAEQGQNASSESFEVWNSGNTTALSYNISDNVSWLSVSPGSGISSGIHQVHQITYSTSGLAPGGHTGTITISAPGATNPTTVIDVALYVNANMTPTLSVTPTGIFKFFEQGQNAPNSTFKVWNSANSTPMPYSITDNQQWMSVSPASGTASSSQQILTVTYDTAGLSAGNYSGTITVNAPNATNTSSNISVSLTVNPLPAPPNDNLANAINLTGENGTITGSNVNATRETNEPIIFSTAPGGASVWWSWTAPITGSAIFDTFGSSFDTLLGVYIGNNYPLFFVGDNDNFGGTTSYVNFQASIGTTYKIAVDGFGGSTGNIILNHAVTPNTSLVPDWAMYE